MTPINETNLPTLMSETFKENSNWSQTFSILYKQLGQQKEKYSSIKNNFGSIFTYELIKRQINIEDFSQTFSVMLKTFSKDGIESLYSRYFDWDSEVNLKDYLKENRFDNRFSCWTNMSYIFYNLDGDKKIFDNSTFPYFKIMLSSLDKNNVLAIYGAGINKLVFGMHNIEAFIPVLEIVQKNKVYEIERPSYNHSFLKMFINFVAENSYKLSDQENIEQFKFLEKNIANFSSLYKKCLISKRKNNYNPCDNDKLEINFSVMNLLLSVGIDTCSIINSKYLKKYNELKKDASNKHHNLFEEVSSALTVGLGKKKIAEFKLDIDTNAPLSKNFVILKYLEHSVKNNKNISLTPIVKNYINEQIKEISKDYNSISYSLDLDAIDSYIKYESLNSLVPHKNNTGKKNKI